MTRLTAIPFIVLVLLFAGCHGHSYDGGDHANAHDADDGHGDAAADADGHGADDGHGHATAVVTVIAVLQLANGGRGAPPLVRATHEQLTTDLGVEWFPSLSPDGEWVVYAGQSSGNWDIYLKSVGGQNPINLTQDAPDVDDQPAFSPDGQRIAFRSSRDGGGIFVMGRTGEAVRRVTRRGYKPTWSPDGTELAYATENVEMTTRNSNPVTSASPGMASGSKGSFSISKSVASSMRNGSRRSSARRSEPGRERVPDCRLQLPALAQA